MTKLLPYISGDSVMLLVNFLLLRSFLICFRNFSSYYDNKANFLESLGFLMFTKIFSRFCYTLEQTWNNELKTVEFCIVVEIFKTRLNVHLISCPDHLKLICGHWLSAWGFNALIYLLLRLEVFSAYICSITIILND